MPERYAYDDPPVRRQGSWQRSLAGVIFGMALLVLTYGFVIRPWVSRTIGERIASAIETQISAQIEGQLAGQIEGQIAGQLTDQLSGAPADAAAEPIPMETLAAALETAVATSGTPLTIVGGNPAQNPGPAGEAGGEQGAQAATALAAGIGQALGEPSTTILLAETLTPAPGQAAGGNDTQATAEAAAQTADEPDPQPADASVGQPTTNPALPTATVAPDATATLENTPTPMPTPSPEPLATALPRVIEELPSGEVVVTEEEANRRIARRLENTGPIEAVTMRFVPDEIRVTLVILGTVNEVRSGLVVTDGQVAVRNPILTGPIALVISVSDLIAPIERQVNTSIGVTDRELLAVRIETGQIVVTIR